MRAKPADIAFISEFKKKGCLYGKWGGNHKTIEVNRCHIQGLPSKREDLASFSVFSVTRGLQLYLLGCVKFRMQLSNMLSNYSRRPRHVFSTYT